MDRGGDKKTHDFMNHVLACQACKVQFNGTGASGHLLIHVLSCGRDLCPVNERENNSQSILLV